MMSRMSIGLVAWSLLMMMIGCSKNSPTQTGSGNNNNNNSNYAVGEFGFVYNGKTIDSKNNAKGAAGAIYYQPSGGQNINTHSWVLTVSLGYAVDPNQTNEGVGLNIAIPMVSTSPQSYSIGLGSNPSPTTATLTINDTVSYHSIVGGTVTVTAFDTINNRVSGTFNFIATVEQPRSGFSTNDTVVSGFFNELSIITGAFGQGTLTANAGPISFINDPYTLYAYTSPIDGWLSITGSQTVDSTVRGVTIIIQGAALGTFTFNGNLLTPGEGIAAYSANPIFGSQVSPISMNATSGQLQITSYDTIHHRLSGVYSFSGIDVDSGDTIHVTNGKINNVLWGAE